MYIGTQASLAVEKYLAALNSNDLVQRLSWDDWRSIEAPFDTIGFAQKGISVRYHRNGYDWDIHGCLYTPEKEVDRKVAFIMFPGGSGNEHNVDLTPDGRPGIARVLARQGFTTLALSYTGLYPPNGRWSKPASTRLPHYLLDRELPEAEILDRNLKCTFNVIVQGAAKLIDENLGGRDIIAYGHSTGGPMAAHLHRFLKKSTVRAIAGFGSGGPDGWRKEWREKTGLEGSKPVPVDQILRRTKERLLSMGYAIDTELCPWGSLEHYIELCEPLRSHINPSLGYNQHMADPAVIGQYAERTSLPLEEYLDHLQEPKAAWLRGLNVLLLVGEKDHGHWELGERVEDKREIFMARKYESNGARARVVWFPRYGHNAYAEMYCETIPHLWLWAFKSGYFDR